MPETSAPPTTALMAGCPHLPTVKRSLRALFSRFSLEKFRDCFSRNIAPEAVALPETGDLTAGVAEAARALACHLTIPPESIQVCFRDDLPHPGQVRLTPTGPYLVEIHARYREPGREVRGDIAAVLAHELTHVFLHRAELRFPDRWGNEILTDVAAVYLGVGWLCVNAYRRREQYHREVTGLFSRDVYCRVQEAGLGYLTPEEFGYVLAKRTLALGDRPHNLFTSPAARVAFGLGLRRAQGEHRSPPLVTCSPSERLRYAWHCRLLQKSGADRSTPRRSGAGTYVLEWSNGLTVTFECPGCTQRLRLPAGKGKLTARCDLCGSDLACNT